jgi:hypothetical protein
MEILKSNIFHRNSSDANLENLLDMKNINFKNENYILKHNMNSNLKFFKDELTIKYIGKGNNTIDYAVNFLLFHINLFYFSQYNQQILLIKIIQYFILKLKYVMKVQKKT